ncbi:uncharacterized protein PADG_01578 [Paracoccidioides brasiliensis Pb18]|uniref:tRNA (adenine(58)-N(1))-methyltransferase catalytic subunit TRM61 n=1 Tax=Paracoccidioides brasiliensis (strain Pb18) TaxID=502780 RepID=C1G3R2_PARBD|nr:uncharacterized protein PADG_01578 [Paracoccidioides brasiliensis Pb18]EEH45428.2 hypothetical protein PADG_01578 [Paracoccidioides brasiliensis Pb18]
MARLFAPLRRVCTRAYSSGTLGSKPFVFQEGDRVIINSKNPVLTKPLKKDDQTTVANGTLKHDDIIGKQSRDAVRTTKGSLLRVTQPTLEDYIVLSPRHVTPVYPADANLIVSYLDIHAVPSASEEERDEPLEILEAGTGHGSLTLHLARAINAANTRPPTRPRRSQCHILEQPETKKTGIKKEKRESEVPAEDAEIQRKWDAWCAQRNAVVHTVDVSPVYSKHAENIVRGFRRGIYVGNVDFYVSRVEHWVKEQAARRSAKDGTLDPFLSHVILDMPSAHLRIPHVTPVMRDDAVLLIFMPNVTQLAECVDIIQRQNLPFFQEKIVELGTGISNGRLWDIRITTKRKRSNCLEEEEMANEPPHEMSEDPTDGAVEETIIPVAQRDKKGEQVLVCRPQAGRRIAGGGFVGVWRKKKKKRNLR